MPAYATCKFPLLDAWKDAGDRNKVIATVDSVLSGYAQIVLSDNSVTGLLLVVATFLASVPMGVASLVCAFTAVLFARFLGVPSILLRLGLHSFCPALCGFGLAALVFPEQGIPISMIVLAIMCGLLCVPLTAGMAAFFGNWGLSGFSLPFCLILAFVVPASLNFTSMPVAGVFLPYMNAMADPVAAGSGWTIAEYGSAVLNGFAECIFQANGLSGLLVLAGIIISSRVDFCSAVLAVMAATLTAILLGLPKGAVMAGLYGFNAVFIVLVLFGRGFAMSLRSFVYAMCAACLSVFVYAALAAIFAPMGIPVAAFPFALIAISSLMGRDFFTGLRFVELAHWGVPETIARLAREQDAAVAATALDQTAGEGESA